MPERLLNLLWYAALIGLAVLLMEHVLDRLKGPARKHLGLE